MCRIFWIFVFLTGLLVFFSRVVTAEDISGYPHVIDVDTLEVSGVRVRLYGIDGPERGQSCAVNRKLFFCGLEAIDVLIHVIGEAVVRCEKHGIGAYGRILAICYANGINLNLFLVSKGWAVSHPHFYFAIEEADAKIHHRGLWRGRFVMPWDWRKGKRLARSEINQCRIKGNIGKLGLKIHHVPGDRFYDKVKISVGRGERWFCSEEEAVNAGWKREAR